MAIGKTKKNNNRDNKKTQRYLRRLDRGNIKALGLEELFQTINPDGATTRN